MLENDNFQEIIIDNNGKSLNGWIKFNTKEENSPLVIMFNGNAINSSNAFANYLNNNIFDYFSNYNVMMIDYPGYGLSEGSPSDKTMFESGLKIYDYAKNLNYVDENNIIIFGYSIGTGVATYVSSQRNVNGLILIAPYDNALSLYNDNVNIFYGPLKLLAKYKFESTLYAPNVKVDPLIITSYNDEVINYNFTVNLSKYFNNVEELIILNEVKHNDYFSQKEVLNKIKDYLEKRLN